MRTLMLRPLSNNTGVLQAHCHAENGHRESRDEHTAQNPLHLLLASSARQVSREQQMR